MSGEIEARLKALNLSLPEAAIPVANYVPTVRSGDLLFVSGQLAVAAGGAMTKGVVGRDVTIEDGQAAARACALNILSQARAALGTLDRVAQVVKLTGFVASTADFGEHPKIINGASDLMVEVFGEKGRHTRAAVGASSLPMNSAVEVEAIFQVSDA